MGWVLQQPIMLIFIGLVVIGILIYVWSQTSQRWPLYAAASTFLLTGLCVTYAEMVETDGESLNRTLSEIATVVRSNDVDELLTYIAPQAKECRRRAGDEMPFYEFSMCNVVRVRELEVDQEAFPKTAKVEFDVLARVGPRNSGMKQLVQRVVVLDFVQQSTGQWVIVDYDHWDPRQAIQ